MIYKVSHKVHIWAFILSSIICMILFRFMWPSLYKMIEVCMSSPIKSISINYALISLGLVSVMALIHESIHGITSMIFGGKVVIKFKLLYGYTKEISNKPFSRFQFLSILLAPMIVMTLLLLPINHWTTNLIIVFNIMGSTGDILMSLFVFKHSKNASIVSNDEGFKIIYH